ncbi:hypothetical protein J2741_000835 [Methanolinea mesophila]|nr:hypothetical protein [Methanolinea mesophila]
MWWKYYSCYAYIAREEVSLNRTHRMREISGHAHTTSSRDYEETVQTDQQPMKFPGPCQPEGSIRTPHIQFPGGRSGRLTLFQAGKTFGKCFNGPRRIRQIFSLLRGLSPDLYRTGVYNLRGPNRKKCTTGSYPGPAGIYPFSYPEPRRRYLRKICLEFPKKI